MAMNKTHTLKIVDVAPMVLDSEDTNASTSSDDSRRLYVTLASEKVAGSNAPIFSKRTSSLEGSVSNTDVSERVTEHRQALSLVIEQAPLPHVLFKLG